MANTLKYTTGEGDRYRVRWRCRGCERHPHGGQHSKTFTRAKDAQAFENDRTREEIIGEPIDVKPEAATFGEFAGLRLEGERVVLVENEGWFARYRGSQVKPSTYQRRVDALLHLRPLLHLPIERVTPEKVETIIISLYEHPRTAKVVKETITMILRNARVYNHKVDDRLFVSPKDGGVSTPTYRAPEKVFLTGEQVEALAAQAAKDKENGIVLASLVRFAEVTGLREIEITGLEDKHIVVRDKRAIAVRITRDITKSDAGVRDVPLTRQAREYLRASMLARPRGSTFCFPGAKGGRLNGRFLDKKLRGWRGKAGLPEGTTFHSLRHTFASRMIEVPVQPKALQKLMGHDDWTVTMNTYGKLYPDATWEAMVAFQEYLDAPKRTAVDDLIAALADG